MAKQILIDSYFGMVRTGLAENNELVDYYEESPEAGRNKGNIYRGVVKKVDAPIQAAFVKFAGGRDGFLPLRDASAGKPPKPGDSVLVQVVKDEVGDKGAALTAKLSLSGRYLVYIPERDGEGGVSSKITDEERAALKKALGELQIPDGASVILRTAASDKSVAELQADLDRLVETHREIVDKFDKGNDPALLFREAPPALRYLREYYTDDVERIWVNQEEVLDQCRQFFYLYEPKSAAKVVLSQDGPLLFQRLGYEAEVEKLTSRRVGLPSGANIVIDQAEALVAIDVNSAKAGGRAEEQKKGKGRGRDKRRGGGDLEETVFAVNKEAATEIARQLRLRDLGGIIIVDFIDMEQEKHRRQIEDAMRKALAHDKAKVKVYDISPLGIMQISRQRLRKAGHQFSRLTCDACQGRGFHPSPSAGALAALRKLEERLHGKKAGQVLAVTVPYPVANKLMNEFREHLVGLEKRYGCVVKLNALPAASGDPAVSVLGGGEQGSREGRPQERPEEGRGRERGEGRNDGRREGGGRPEARHADGRRDGRQRGEVGEETLREGRGERRQDGRPEGRGQGERRPEARGERQDGRRDERQGEQRGSAAQETRAGSEGAGIPAQDRSQPIMEGEGNGLREGRGRRRRRGRGRGRDRGHEPRESQAVRPLEAYEPVEGESLPQGTRLKASTRKEAEPSEDRFAQAQGPEESAFEPGPEPAWEGERRPEPEPEPVLVAAGAADEGPGFAGSAGEPVGEGSARNVEVTAGAAGPSEAAGKPRGSRGGRGRGGAGRSAAPAKADGRKAAPARGQARSKAEAKPSKPKSGSGSAAKGAARGGRSPKRGRGGSAKDD